MEKSEKKSVIKIIEETLTRYKKNVPVPDYLFLVKEYRNVCIKLNKLMTKEKDRNRKFIEVKKTLVEEHNQEVKKLKEEIDDYKRLVLKYKKAVKSRKNVQIEEKDCADDNIQNLRQDIDSIIEKHFSGEKIQKILEEIVHHMTAENHYLDFRKINLQTFDAHKIPLLQRSIYKVVMSTIDSNSTTVISAITNALLRKHFAYIHTLFAKKVLEASNISRGIFKFFGDVFVEQEDGQRWSSFAITRFMNEYSSQISTIQKLNTEIEKSQKSLDEVINKLRVAEDSSDRDHYHNLKNKKKQIEREIHRYKLQISEEQVLLSELQLKYSQLLEALTKTLLEKRRVFRVD